MQAHVNTWRVAIPRRFAASGGRRIRRAHGRLLKIFSESEK